MSELVTHVALFDEKGQLATFGPGDDIPEWALKKITNPNVWDEPPVVDDDSDPAGGGSGDGPPPRAGKGSSEGAWRKYAEDKGVDVTDIAGRDEIIAAVEAAGVPVE